MFSTSSLRALKTKGKCLYEWLVENKLKSPKSTQFQPKSRPSHLEKLSTNAVITLETCDGTGRPLTYN